MAKFKKRPNKTDDQASISRIAGRNPVREALADPDLEVSKVLIQKGAQGKPIQEVKKLAKSAGVPVQEVPQTVLNRLSNGVRHQGIMAEIKPIGYLELEDMLHAIAPDNDTVKAKKPLLVLLDQIEDPQNYGAIIRSVRGAGAAGIIVPRHGMAPLNAAAIKTSAGIALQMPIAEVTNLAHAIDQLKERGYWVYGAAGEAEDSVWDTDWDRAIALVIGSEGAGLRARIRKSCDGLVAIPLTAGVESLNASVAAAVISYIITHGQKN